MAYNELIKKMEETRNYMRQFLIYGFRSRDEFDTKSARSYDNEKRRIESWLADYMTFRQDGNGKAVFLSMDSREIPHNPLYKAWKASSFTKNDMSLHFLLLDILMEKEALGVSEIIDCIDTEYLPLFQYATPIDESILRKKLKEYTNLGLLVSQKQGQKLVYLLAENNVDLEKWREAISFFAEENPLGVIGSFLMDKFAESESPFLFKHRYLLFTLDSNIMLTLLNAMNTSSKVEVAFFNNGSEQKHTRVVVPLKLYISVQGGRQYLAAMNPYKERIFFFRLDSIKTIKVLDAFDAYSEYQAYFEKEQQHIWGVATGSGVLEDVEMTLTIGDNEEYIVQRLQREKRFGEVTQIDALTWRFTISVYSAWELLPWVRTFIGRIASFTCSNKQTEKLFWSDFSELVRKYGGDCE